MNPLAGGQRLSGLHAQHVVRRLMDQVELQPIVAERQLVAAAAVEALVVEHVDEVVGLAFAQLDPQVEAEFLRALVAPHVLRGEADRVVEQHGLASHAVDERARCSRAPGAPPGRPLGVQRSSSALRPMGSWRRVIAMGLWKTKPVFVASRKAWPRSSEARRPSICCRPSASSITRGRGSLGRLPYLRARPDHQRLGGGDERGVERIPGFERRIEGAFDEWR